MDWSNHLNSEPRSGSDYADRQIRAARRVLVDLGQVLASFHDSIVIVGGWVPELLIPPQQPKHIGSIDVDIALDAAKLTGGRYAELLKLLFVTGRYEKGPKPFQLKTTVWLGDSEPPIIVEIDFLASSDIKLRKNQPKRLDDFRVLRFSACEVAFHSPVDTEVRGQMISGAENIVCFLVASIADFVIMKAHAIALRDKPKDVYDLCYCLDAFPDGLEALGQQWSNRIENPLVRQAVEILRKKFRTVDHFGPRQLAIFHDALEIEEAAMHARRAYELVQGLLAAL